MAWLYVDEFSRLGIDAHGQAVMAPDYTYLLAQYRIAIGGSSAPGPAFTGQTRFIQFHCDAICSIAIAAAASVTAVPTVGRIAANETRFVGVAPNVQAIAVITNS
jgi:hypothetical protein